MDGLQELGLALIGELPGPEGLYRCWLRGCIVRVLRPPCTPSLPPMHPIPTMDGLRLRRLLDTPPQPHQRWGLMGTASYGTYAGSLIPA